MEKRHLKGRLIALDNASARHFDENGYLHVDGNALTCDQVAGYWGYELPQDEAHPLESDRIYYAYRPAEELKKALDTYNGVPLLMEHAFDSPTEPLKELRVGAIGTDAEWDDPFVRNSLTIWDQAAIDAVMSGRLSDLSCGYTFEPDWTPGRTADGIEYDFMMKSIKCNHVALVERGRATDCRVADEQPIFHNEVHMNEKLAEALKAAGIEATPEQVAKILVALKGTEEEPAEQEEDEDTPEAQPQETAQETAEEKPEADEAPESKDEDAEKPAEDEGEDKPEGEEPAKDEDACKDEDKPEAKAGDAAAVDAQAIAKAVALRFSAADSVRPFVGKVDPMAFKSEGAIYAHALKTMGFDSVPETSAADVFNAILKERKSRKATDAKPEEPSAVADRLAALI